ncbi:hypothetical protein [Bdellovibrio sp. HCB2-146]|uniref:hypothetical protein n=1 Tax=Bdellovibrio sp. HCB2-146 TaxID=3394362 RepID=UPI0039BC8473
MKKLILGLLLSSQVSVYANPQHDLIGTFQDALRFVESSSFNNETCPTFLNAFVKSSASPDWNRYSNEELQAFSKDSIEQIWQLRLALHKKLGGANPACVRGIRSAFFALRETSDYLGEFAFQQPSLNPSTLDFQKQATPIQDYSAYPAYKISPSFPGDFKFKSGDVMLARGVSFVSALISQITDQGSKFSHVIMVNVNPKTGEERTIESYIGVGVSTYEMPWALRNENARLLVLRPKDQKLAAKAADIALEKAQNGDGKNKPIPYDYFSKIDDPSRMGCAEVARASFKWASDGKTVIPAVLSQTDVTNKDFMEKMNIEQGPVYAPDDLATDPNFELVLDWTDYRLVRDSRQRDAILGEIMRWVNALQYNFHDTPQAYLAKNVVLPSRKTFLWPLIQKAIKAPNLDRDFPKETLGVVTVVNQIGNTLLERLKAADERYYAQYHRSMTTAQLKAYLDNMRIADQRNYLEGRPTLIHYALRPNNIVRRPIRR